MLMNNVILISSVCFVAMVSPGPDFLLVTKNALSYSLKCGLATAAGIIAGCSVHASYCLLGLAFLITKSVITFSVIKHVGALYLIYLGIKSLRSEKLPEERVPGIIDKRDLSIKEAFVQGFLCNLLNPKLAVFLLSLFTQFIPINATFREKSVVASIFIVESVIYWPLVVLILQVSVIKNLFSSMQNALGKFCGALLVILGIRVICQEN